MQRRRNADDSYRKVERQVQAFLQLLLDGSIVEAEAKLPEILALYGRELRRKGQCKNKIAVKLRLLADMFQLDPNFGTNRLLALYRRSDKGRARDLKSLASAILGGLDRASADMLLVFLNVSMPVATWSPEGADLSNILDTWDSEGITDVIVVYREQSGELGGSRVCAHVERDDVLVWEDERVYAWEFDNDFYEYVARSYSFDVATLRSSIKTPVGFGQMVFEFCHYQGCPTLNNFDKSSFKRRFAVELAYEQRGWI